MPKPEEAILMFKKMFALASVTALVGLVSTAAVAGCSSSGGGGDDADGGGGAEGGLKEAGAPPEAGEGEDAAGPPEEQTVGKACASVADCAVAGSKNDNVCSKGAFAIGDLFGTPVCIQTSCTQGAGKTVGDLLCDGNAGLCVTASGGSKGVCLPYCDFDSTTISSACEGGNTCAIAYSAADKDGKAIAIGYCEASCQADADCKGTAGQKCQIESGLCVNADKYVAFAKAVGEGCDASKTAPADCNCNPVGGTGADKDKGVCTRACITGAAGDAACGAAIAGWTCTAKLPAKDAMDKTQFTAQPGGVRGQCALPCVDDTTCAPLQGSTGAPMKCKAYANGKFCETTDT
jgi:hypothetical protein